MNNARKRNGGFGLLELLIVVVLAKLFVGVVASKHGEREEKVDEPTSQSVTVALVAPVTQIAAGSSETFVFLVTLRGAGGLTLDATGRNVAFSVTPSVGSPPELTIDINSGPAGPSGLTAVTVTAHEDYTGPGTVTGTDTGSGESAPAQFTVVPPP